MSHNDFFLGVKEKSHLSGKSITRQLRITIFHDCTLATRSLDQS